MIRVGNIVSTLREDIPRHTHDISPIYWSFHDVLNTDSTER